MTTQPDLTIVKIHVRQDSWKVAPIRVKQQFGIHVELKGQTLVDTMKNATHITLLVQKRNIPFIELYPFVTKVEKVLKEELINGTK